MTELILGVGYDLVENALQRAEPKFGGGKGPDGKLQAGGLTPFDAKLKEVWTRVCDLVERSARQGWETVKQDVTMIGGYVSQAAKELGKRAKEFRARVLESIRQIMTESFDLVLASLRSEIAVGEAKYRLETIDLDHKLVFSGSLEGSLEALCKFVGSGELSVKASYKAR
jgi:hypothetical protein